MHLAWPPTGTVYVHTYNVGLVAGYLLYTDFHMRYQSRYSQLKNEIPGILKSHDKADSFQIVLTSG
jgi:hypothetical protein